MPKAGKLRPFAFDALTPYTGGDDRLTAAAGASVAVYYQGADAAETKAIANSTVAALAIHDPGMLRIGDYIAPIDDTSSLGLITGITARNSLTIQGINNFSVTDGDRIVCLSRNVIVYSDAVGGDAIGTTNITADSVGHVRGFVDAYAVDVRITGASITSRTVKDVPTAPADLHFDVTAFGARGDGSTDDRTALNALFKLVALLAPDEGMATVYFPRGTYMLRDELYPDGDLTTTVHNVRITADPGTVLKVDSTGTWGANSAIFKFRNTATLRRNWIIENLVFDCDNYSSPGAGVAITIGCIFTSRIDHLTIQHCVFQNCGEATATIDPRNDGILLGDDIGNVARGQATFVTIRDCKFDTIRRNGISGLDVEHLRVENCQFIYCQNSDIDIEPNHAFQYAFDITIADCQFSNHTDSGTAHLILIPGAALRDSLYPEQMACARIRDCTFPVDRNASAAIRVVNWSQVWIDRCWIDDAEDFGIQVNDCKDVWIDGCFVQDGGVAQHALIRVDAAVGSGAGIQATVPPENVFITRCALQGSPGYGIQASDLQKAIIAMNIVEDCDGDSAARDNIRIATVPGPTGMDDVDQVMLIGNLSNDNTLGNGIRISADSNTPADCLIGGNLCLGNGDLEQISDEGARTVWFHNKTRDSGNTAEFESIMTVPSGKAPADSGRDDWVFTVTIAQGTGAGQVDTSNANAEVTSKLYISPRSDVAGTVLATGSVWAEVTGVGGNVRLHHPNIPGGGNDAVFDVMIIGATDANT